MNLRQQASLRKALKGGGWKSILPLPLCVDILKSQGYTTRAAQAELVSLGRTFDSS